MEEKIYQIDEIMQVLPHRYPFLLIDKVKVTEKGVSGIGYKNVTVNEPFFQGHFPSNPIMPGVLIVESMAQTAGFVIATGADELKPTGVLFMGVDKVKFRRQVIPGDRLELHVSKIKAHGNVFVCETKAYVDGNLASEALLTAMVNP